MLDFYVLMQDKRGEILAESMKKDGFSIQKNDGLEKKRGIYLLPFSFSEEALCAFLTQLAPKSLVFSGNGGETAKALAEERSITLVPLLEEKEYLTQNARATAEGTLAAIIESTPRMICENEYLICGYGNCGKAIAHLLKSVGAVPFVFSREGSMARARQDGFFTYHAPGGSMARFDVIINTVPAPLFTPDFLDAIAEGTHFFQIASGFSGLCTEDLERRGIRFHPLPSLPGLCAPESEARTIKRVMLPFIHQFYHESE